jgi:ribosome biogenesis protein BRX1
MPCAVPSLTTHRHRHLLNDLCSLLPHTYKDTKLDTKSSNQYNVALNGLADLHSCNYIFFLEARKRGQDLYLWLAGAPNGPTIKFSVSNVHTMAELDFGGNCLKGGRGLVMFDKSFDENMEGYEHKTLIREMLKGVFCVPSKGVRGMKPFVDRIVGIYGLDGKIWIRIYEIRETENDGKEDLPKGSRTNISLVEVGPRMVLTPILVMEGSFGGPIIYENKQYVSPNQLRSEVRLRKASKYADRRGGVEERVIKRKSLGLESGFKKKRSKLDDTELFG